ncbi:MAG TPA: hypothetical protein VFK05_13700 [Polyangiaceae bacterium]|nr:hypothetical protein [Polyangiaceae bacterium]
MRHSQTLGALAAILAHAPLASAQAPAPAAGGNEPRAAIGAAPLDSGPQPIQGKWGTNFYGFVEFDAIHDSTQAGLTTINDSQGNGALARPGTYAGSNGQTLFGARNSRIGFKLDAPASDGLHASAVLEMDFLGNQPTSTASQAALIGNPTFRIRHMALKLENPIADVLLGQYWQLFGWQSAFHPNTVEIQGVPGQVYSRAPQARLSKTIKTDPIDVDLAIAAARPVSRNSQVPDGQAGLKLTLNRWQGLHTAGSTGTAVDGLAVGVSGVARHFILPGFYGTGHSRTNGWGLSIDALLPIIPATLAKRANALTVTGSFVTGTGISDLYTGLTGGVGFPAPANPGMMTPPPTYAADIDNGLVTFDENGKIHTIDWQSYIVGIQYYLPPAGKVWLSANYSAMKSNNAASYTNAAGLSKIFDKSYWLDANVFCDVTAAVRLGAEYAYFHQTYADGVAAKNTRLQFSGFYLF